MRAKIIISKSHVLWYLTWIMDMNGLMRSLTSCSCSGSFYVGIFDRDFLHPRNLPHCLLSIPRLLPDPTPRGEIWSARQGAFSQSVAVWGLQLTSGTRGNTGRTHLGGMSGSPGCVQRNRRDLKCWSLGPVWPAVLQVTSWGKSWGTQSPCIWLRGCPKQYCCLTICRNI